MGPPHLKPGGWERQSEAVRGKKLFKNWDIYGHFGTLRGEGRLGKNSWGKLGHLGTRDGGVVGGYRGHGYRLASWLRMWQGGSVSGWGGEAFRVILAGVVGRAHHERGGCLVRPSVGPSTGLRTILRRAEDERTGWFGGFSTNGGWGLPRTGGSWRTEDFSSGAGWTFEGARMIL